MDTINSEDPIIPLTRPERMPPVLTTEDLRQRWRSLLGPEGFGPTSVYLIWFDARGRQLPCVVPIDDLEDDLEPAHVQNLMMIADTVAHDAGATSLALALTRPGPATVSPVDRSRARALLAGGQSLAIKLWPLHLATENQVRQLGGDDLL